LWCNEVLSTYDISATHRSAEQPSNQSVMYILTYSISVRNIPVGTLPVLRKIFPKYIAEYQYCSNIFSVKGIVRGTHTSRLQPSSHNASSSPRVCPLQVFVDCTAYRTSCSRWHTSVSPAYPHYADSQHLPHRLCIEVSTANIFEAFSVTQCNSTSNKKHTSQQSIRCCGLGLTSVPSGAITFPGVRVPSFSEYLYDTATYKVRRTSYWSAQPI
jgi:hypothetical protein